MSARLFSLALDASMPTPAAKLVLVKLVDCCDDEGRRIFPSVATLARAGMCSERTVQRVLGLFCAAGLLRRVREGGQGPKSTATYELNLATLARLARESWDTVTGGCRLDETVDNPVSHAQDAYQDGSEDDGSDAAKGDTVSPLDPARVTPATDKGDRAVSPNPSREPLNLGRERAGMDVQSGDRPEGPAPVGMHGVQATGEQALGEPALSDARIPGLEEFLKVWPTAAVDSRARIEAAWGELPFGERRRAIKGVRPYLELAKALKRGIVPAGHTYLAERRWTNLAEMATTRDAGKPVALNAWGKPWWAVLLAKIASGNMASARFMVSQAATSGVFCIPGAEMPDDSAIEGWRAFPSDGAVASRWIDWLRDRRVILPDFTKQIWLHLPGEYPPGQLAGQGHAIQDLDVQL